MKILNPISIAAEARRAAASPASHGPGRARLRLAAFFPLVWTGGAVAQQTIEAAPQTSNPTPEFRSAAGYFQLHSSLGYTDNAFQVGSDKTGEAVASAGFDVDYAHKGNRFDFDSRGALNWIEYLQNSRTGYASGALNASALFGKSDDLLQWAAWESFGQLDTDPLAAPTPVNTENVNYFTTGPYLNFNLGGDNRLTVRALYSNANYQKSPYNSNSIDVGASLAHALSASSSVALNVDARRTSMESASLVPDYDIRSAFVSYVAASTRTRFNVDVGYITLHYAGQNSGAPLVSAGLDRRISASSTVYLQLQSGYSSSAESVRGAAALIAPSSLSAGASSPNPYKQESASIGWNFNRPRTEVSLFSSLTRQRYQNQADLNQNNISVQAQVLYRLRPSVAAVVSVRRETEKYRTLGADVTQTTLIAGLTKTFTRVGLTVRFERFDRGGTNNGNNIVAVYDENRVGLYVTYDLLGRHLIPTSLGEH